MISSVYSSDYILKIGKQFVGSCSDGFRVGHPEETASKAHCRFLLYFAWEVTNMKPNAKPRINELWYKKESNKSAVKWNAIKDFVHQQIQE